MKRTILWVWLLFVWMAAAAAAQTPVIDWEKQQGETLQHYRALVQIDTSNPPGNETKAVEYLKKVLEAEGIPTKTFASEPTRANLVARLKGNGSKRPILLMAHTDVVGVQRQKWPVDPFGAVLKDGYVWGRGTSDDKDKVAADLMVMLLLKRSGVQLDRDVIFLAEAGEETNSLENGRVTAVQVATAEKVPNWVRLVVQGTSGHGSISRVDNPVVHLAAAVGKLGAWETPMRLNDTTRAYFERLASISPPEKAARYNGLTDPRSSAAIQRYFAEHEPEHYSMLRTSVVPTVIRGGFQTNVIPSEAEASIDIRVLPDEDTARFAEEMRRVIGDPSIRIEPISTGARVPTPPSRIDNEMFRALEAVSQRLYPGSITLPVMLTAATDCAQLRAKGLQCYGIDPPVSDEDRANYSWHSDVERLQESSLYKFVEFTWGVVTEVAAKK